MISSSKHEESAIASEIDSSLNTFLSDNFSRDFYDFLFQPNGFKHKAGSFTLEDIKKFFTYDKIRSTISLVNTADREMNEVLLKEFLPVNDITLGEGIDDKQEGTKFFNWEDLLQ